MSGRTLSRCRLVPRLAPLAYPDFNQENWPVMVDLDYQEKIGDLQHLAKGWYSAAEEQLRRQYLEQSH